MTDHERIIALRNAALERRLRGEIGEVQLHRILDANPIPGIEEDTAQRARELVQRNEALERRLRPADTLPRVVRDESPAERVAASALKRVNGVLVRLNRWLREKQR